MMEERNRMVNSDLSASKRDEIARLANAQREAIAGANGRGPEKIIAKQRYQAADRVAAACVSRAKAPSRTLTDWIDRFVCNRYVGPLLLAGILFAIYQLAIVQGYNLTNYWWPVLSSIKGAILSILPPEGLLFDPWVRDLVDWSLSGILAVLNYVPIFAILFALVAILEDTGYMARIAFVLDRLFRPFGLHGQSALPLMLGGLFVGGCAIPGVMACRGIKDERARMTTMLVVPMMNCLAKIPFYLLLIGLFFRQVSGLMMFIMSTITLLFALSVSKILSLTVLKHRPSAPFVLELPVYHLPTPQNVLRRVAERLWIFVKKITTVVLVVMIALFALMNLPGLGDAQRASLEAGMNVLFADMRSDLGAENPYVAWITTDEGATSYSTFSSELKQARRSITDDDAQRVMERARFEENPELFKIASRGRVELTDEEIAAFDAYHTAYRNALAAFFAEYERTPEAAREALVAGFYTSWEAVDPFFFSLVRTGNVQRRGNEVYDGDAAAAGKAFTTFERGVQALRSDRHQAQMEGSILGRIAIAIEPVTRLAGFNWRINIGLLGAFAAKESVVATLGSIYKSGGATTDSDAMLETKILDQETGWTSLHAAAMMLFMALYPPCIAAMLMIKVQAGWRWMLFGISYPMILGLLVAVLLFSGGQALGLSGLQAMLTLYAWLLVVTIVLGFIKPRGRAGDLRST